MALNLIMTEQKELTPRITVFGVGGAGGNAVNNMIDKQLQGVEFVVANTDAQALQQSKASYRIQIGVKVTEGLGAGARPAVGAAAAEETLEEIIDHLAGAHMCFITAGMGGGTGTGAAPIIAQAARELGVLTVGVVTKPFQFEGAKRMRQAEEGVEALQKVVDTLIIIPNQNLFRLANEKTTFTEAFAMADDVLYQGVKGVTDLMVKPGLINLDFADVRAVMDEMGKAMMGTGEASGEDRAVQAAEKAIANPLLDEISLNGAKGVLINITGGTDITLFELDEAANRIREKVDPDANIIVGSTLEPDMSGTLRVSVVATGIDAKQNQAEMPIPRRRMADPVPEPRVAPVAEPEPPRGYQQPAAQMRDPAPLHAPEPAFDAEPEEERSFYGDYVAREQEDLFSDLDAVEQQEEPVYRSSRAAGGQYGARTGNVAARPHAPAAPVTQQDHPGDFVAPQPPRRTPGEPSPEALQRLQAAVTRGPTVHREDPRAMPPRHEQAAPPRPHGGVQRPHGAEQDRAAPSSRFGINSLINRMTGHAQPAEPERPAPRRQPPQVSGYDDEHDAEGDRARVEIPAFMRRQAN